MVAANKRTHVNVNLLNAPEYPFIDHCRCADSFAGPIGSAFTATALPWGQMIDSDGWPNDTAVNTHSWGGTVRIPGPDQFAGPYVITWTGDGNVRLVFASLVATETNNTGATYTRNGNCNWTSVSGQTAKIIFNLSGVTGPVAMTIQVASTGGAGGFLKNLKFYRLEDEADLLAGKVFRTGYKQHFINLNPSLVRFMNWSGVNASQLIRFEHRSLPTNAGNYNNWTAGPRYGITSGANQMTLASATGMPVSMQHGEIVTCRIGSTMVRAASTAVVMSGVTKANPGVVTATAHGFNTGDIIIHQMMNSTPGQAPAGMTQLNNVPCTITVIDPDTYSLGIDTSSFSTFTVGRAYQYITLNVGGRGAYPVVNNDGISNASRFGNSYMTAGDHKSFVFDKEFVASTAVTGAWLFTSTGTANVLIGGVPLEFCTALVNELNAMSSNGPIDMWINIPHRGMISSDPDYSAASNWPVKMVDVILNGANGYAGLNASANLYIEHSNETWNTAFTHTNFMKAMGAQRWPASGYSDLSSYSTLRAVLAMEEIRAAYPGNTRLKFVLGLQGTNGAAGSVNSPRINGNTYFDGDALNTWHDDPGDHFDYWAWAAYFFNNDSTPANSLATNAAAWVAAGTDPVAKEAAYAAYVAGITTQALGGFETTGYYSGTHLPAYAAAALAKGKKTCMYEGGWDKAVTGFTTDQNNFLAACKRSRSWAKALRAYHDAFNSVNGAEAPADYIITSRQWGHSPTDTYSGGVEGASLDPAWQELVLRNNGKSRLIVTT